MSDLIGTQFVMTAMRRRAKRFKSLQEAFDSWPKRTDHNGCHIWLGNNNGAHKYGVLHFDGIKFAHRVAYELRNGVIPEGLVIDHTCHNRLCVNAEHLRAVTSKQNQENRKSCNRNSTTGVRGVTIRRNRKKKYSASVMHNGKQLSGGCYSTLEEAEAAVIELRRRIFTHSEDKSP